MKQKEAIKFLKNLFGKEVFIGTGSMSLNGKHKCKTVSVVFSKRGNKKIIDELLKNNFEIMTSAKMHFNMYRQSLKYKGYEMECRAELKCDD